MNVIRYQLNQYSQIFIDKNNRIIFHSTPNKNNDEKKLVFSPKSDQQNNLLYTLFQGCSLSECELRNIFKEDEIAFLLSEKILIAESNTSDTLYMRSEAFYQNYLNTDIQNKISNKKILILGIGTHLAWHMVILGVFSVTLVDFDVVNVSNLNRQILYTQCDIGLSKAECLKAHLEAINPNVNIHAINEKLSSQDQLKQLCEQERYDLIIKAADTPAEFPLWLDNVCKEKHIPYVSGITTRDRTLIGPTYIPGKSKYGWSDIIQFDNNAEKHIFGTLPSVGIMLTHIAEEIAIESFKILADIENIKYINKIKTENIFTEKTDIIISKKDKKINHKNTRGTILLHILILTFSFFIANYLSFFKYIIPFLTLFLPFISYNKKKNILYATFVDSIICTAISYAAIILTQFQQTAPITVAILLISTVILCSATAVIFVLINSIIARILKID